MRRITAGLIIAAALLPGAAVAKQQTVTPPGNSGVNQYTEVVPTAGGGRPTGSLPPGGSGGGTGSGALSTGTQQALARAGADGRGAAALANATAPAHKAPRSRPGSHQGAGVPGSTTSQGSVSPFTTLVRAFTGSSDGGLGPLLPVLLVGLALGGGVLALIRHRRAT